MAGNQEDVCAESDAPANEENCLHLQLHTDEAVWMRQIGHLKDWCSATRTVKLGVPALVSTPLAANSIRLLWLFPNLQRLDINFNSTRSCIEQPVLIACAELMHLTSLSLSGGHLPRRSADLDLGVLTSLRRLAALAVRTHGSEGLDGLEDEQLVGVGRLTGLRCLALRASENVTDEGLFALSGLTGLTRLQLVPLGLCVTRSGISRLAACLPHLAHLGVGLHEARQVAALKGLDDAPPHAAPQPPADHPLNSNGMSNDGSRGHSGHSASLLRSPPGAAAGAGPATVTATAIPPPSPPPTQPTPATPPSPSTSSGCSASLSVVLNSPEACASAFLSTLTLVLRGRLGSLRLGTVEAAEPAFLLALGTLTRLSELKLGVSLPEGGRPFSLPLPHLAPLSRLRTLELAVTRELRLPLTPKMVGLLSASWPHLRSLSLSLMTKPEVAPEALRLLGAFGELRELSLFAPLDYCDEDEDGEEEGGFGGGPVGSSGGGMGPLLLPVSPRHLPPHLTHLVLECARLAAHQHQHQHQQQSA
ncbi:hypothetical protein Agub_g7478, partial [Astrephomene gubernaculifera]